jgi:2-polyprenyl-3-methyl-5-hydroxy-6-metoxy-1,4-benzoquinol methylase
MESTSKATEQAPVAGTGEKWVPNLGGERVVEDIHYGWLMKDHLARYHYAKSFCRGKRVLDVATGTGYGANILRQGGAAEVVAVDREQAALDYATGRYGTNGLRWVNGDAYNLPFDKEFDVVVSYETIEHLKEPEKFVVQCKKAMKPDGLYMVSTPWNVGGPYVSDFHEHEFSKEEFDELLRRHFRTVSMVGQRRELKLPLRPLGGIPDAYWKAKIHYGRGSHKLFTVLDRINKVPNYVLAWATGVGETFREQIRPIDEPIKRSPLLKDHYYVMIAMCRL